MESIIRSSNDNIKHSLLCWQFGSRYHRRNPIRHVEHHVRHTNLPIFSNGGNRLFHLVINNLTNKDMARRYSKTTAQQCRFYEVDNIFEYMVETYINGNHSTLRRLYHELNKEARKDFIGFLLVECPPQYHTEILQEIV